MTGPEPALPRGYGRPPARATLSADPEDFRVTEIEKFHPSGAGTHAWLRIRKRGVNTEEVAITLARVAGAPRSAVGFAGMKDRLAIATQWFSVDLAGRAEPRWAPLESEAVEVLEAELDAEASGDRQEMDDEVGRAADRGVDDNRVLDRLGVARAVRDEDRAVDAQQRRGAVYAVVQLRSHAPGRGPDQQPAEAAPPGAARGRAQLAHHQVDHPLADLEHHVAGEAVRHDHVGAGRAQVAALDVPDEAQAGLAQPLVGLDRER